MSSPTRLIVIPALLGAALLSSPARAQGPASACSLISVAEVKSIMKNQGYSGKPESNSGKEVVGGGSACVFSDPSYAASPRPPRVEIVVMKGQGFTAKQRTMKLPANATCSWDYVKGLGDDALFWGCTAPKTYISPLYVKKGASDLVIRVEQRSPATTADIRAQALAIAKVIVPRLK